MTEIIEKLEHGIMICSATGTMLVHIDKGDAEKVVFMLKEQEAVKPVFDEQTGRIWLCGKCGTYVGFEDNDPHDPNEFDKYCRECGRPVLREGR